jgi:inner membrane protein
VALARTASPVLGSLRGPLFAGVLSSNLPDIDLLWMPLFSDPKLGYLLHHRGHTHTLALVIPQALLVAVLAKRLDKEQGFLGLFLISVLGLLLHIGFDACNSYGVHPFWPFDSRWFYGDSLFIIDPYLLLVLLCAVAGGLNARWRVGLGAGLGLIGAGVGVVGGWVAAGLWGLVAGGLWWSWRAAFPGMMWLVMVGVVGLQGFCGRLGGGLVEQALGRQVPEERVIELARTPLPGRPWCVSVLSASLGPGRSYVLRSAWVSLVPELEEPSGCSLDRKRSLKLGAVEFSPDKRVFWEGGWSRPAMELEKSCRVESFLGFARMPWWQEGMLGDFRFDGAGFAEVGREGVCMEVPWEGPVVGEFLRGEKR